MTATWADGPLCGFDTETTGVDTSTARIVTAACTHGLDTTRWLLDPGIDIPAEATAIHGITTDHAREHGEEPAGAVEEIALHLADQCCQGRPIVAFNAAYDLTVLDRELRRYGMDGLAEKLGGLRVIDPFVLDKHADPYRKGKRTLAACCELYGIDLTEAHTSAADASAAVAVARAIGARYPHLAELDIEGLHASQVGWKAEQAASFADYLRRQGKDASDVSSHWPVEPYAAPAVAKAPAKKAPAKASSRSPKQARATDKGRYYADPKTSGSLISVTNVLDTCIAKPALVPWAAKVTAEHILDQLPTYVRRARTDRGGALKDAKAQVRYVKDTAADLGTRVHARVEAHVLGTPFAPDDEVEPFAEQAIAFFDSWGVDLATQIEAAECTVANRTLGYAGTADLFVWLPTGEGDELQLWLVDYKTSSTRPVASTYPEYGLQLAAYRHAEVIWLPDGSDAPVPAVAGTAILNLRVDKHAFIPMPADHQAAFAAFSALLTAAMYMHGAESKPAAMSAPTRELVGA